MQFVTDAHVCTLPALPRYNRETVPVPTGPSSNRGFPGNNESISTGICIQMQPCIEKKHFPPQSNDLLQPYKEKTKGGKKKVSIITGKLPLIVHSAAPGLGGWIDKRITAFTQPLEPRPTAVFQRQGAQAGSDTPNFHTEERVSVK